ncbi:MAG: hypothetical protein JAY98_03545 [Candidatus Thiodiazotropha lotti]|nr:hypothetical protein [Candidatus Thiodiazotropha lotti]MCW4182248.1 hypothetical protein [Candidatus Thiodiazotropha weberae]
MNEGWVWIYPANFEPRSIVKVTNKINQKVVYCEVLAIDRNFRQEYNYPPRENISQNERTIVINGWYRKRLGNIETKLMYDLEILQDNSWWGKLRANTGHPQVVVRLATWLGIISVTLGILGVGLAIK